MVHPNLIPPAFAPGSVWLVGAGPGDPGLLTLHAAHALSVADVVMHDALVAPEILALINPAARLVPVGKRARRGGAMQIRINEGLIGHARAGLRVVRLKGGDPLVFGRGAEEALALAAAGIAFRIIPGISAGIGGTASAGMPLTHRMLARSVTFATGHDVSGAMPDGTDWAALARGADVLVLYMALRTIGSISERLISAGRGADEAVAFIAEATTPRQRVRIATLGTAGAVSAGLDRTAPTLIVIGPTVGLHALLEGWQQTEPMTIDIPALAARARGMN